MDAYQRPPTRDSWFAPFSIDLVLKVLYVTFLHPFVAWVVVLCFRAEHMDWGAMPIRVAYVYALLVTAGWTLAAVNRRIAFGMPRDVDLSEEVIVITGGASGLGLLIAEVYGMRGASVAVLDVKEMENGEARGVTFYKCDVTDKAQVIKAAADIERDVGLFLVILSFFFFFLFFLLFLIPLTRYSSARRRSSSTTPPLSTASACSTSTTTKSTAPWPPTSPRTFTPSRPSSPLLLAARTAAPSSPLPASLASSAPPS